jgi:hypothetical protein
MVSWKEGKMTEELTEEWIFHEEKILNYLQNRLSAWRQKGYPNANQAFTAGLTRFVAYWVEVGREDLRREFTERYEFHSRRDEC